MNCSYVLVFVRFQLSAKHIGHFSVRSRFSHLIASNSEVAFVFEKYNTIMMCLSVMLCFVTNNARSGVTVLSYATTSLAVKL